MRMGLGDALLPTRMGLTSEHGTGDIPAACACAGGTLSCHPLPWGHVYTSPAYLTSGPSGCAPSARGVWAVAAVETAQSTAGSQGQAPSLVPQGSAASTGDRNCSSCASPALPMSPQVGTQIERALLQLGKPHLPSCLPSAVPNLKTTAEVSPPSSWKQAWKFRGCRVITFSAKQRNATARRREMGEPGVAAELGGDRGSAAKSPPLARGKASEWDCSYPCAPGGSPRSRDGNEDPP